MMTSQRKRRLKAKIQASRERLMESHPFFALLLMFLKFISVSDMKKISTNGRCIYFSPDYIDKLYGHELDYILCHQVMHVICGHLWRPYDREGDDYHYACDIQVNAHLYHCDFGTCRYAHLGNVTGRVPGIEKDPAEMTPEEIYECLPFSLYALDERARSRFLMDSDEWWNDRADKGDHGEVIIDLPELSYTPRESADDGALLHEWQGRAASAARSFLSSAKSDAGYGDVPDFVKRMIDKMKEPTVDWRNIIDNFVQEQICDYSFSPPDRRFSDTDFFLPDLSEKEYVLKDILFMVDTSGSISDGDLATVYSEIRGALEQFSGKLIGKLGFFDTAVTPPLPFEDVNSLLSITPIGGGGTDFRTIFHYIRNDYRADLPACIIIFTDGDGPYPPQSETMGFPVLWIINNPHITPPWGKTVRVITEAQS